MAATGSSRMMIGVFIAIIEAIASRCFCPPDKAEIGISSLSDRPTLAKSSRRLLMIS